MSETLSFFGAIAVSMGLLSEEGLAAAVALQEELGSKGVKKRLGDLLCEAQQITPNDVDIILAMQQTYDSVTEETRFGELAIANGFPGQPRLQNTAMRNVFAALKPAGRVEPPSPTPEPATCALESPWNPLWNPHGIPFGMIS